MSAEEEITDAQIATALVSQSPAFVHGPNVPFNVQSRPNKELQPGVSEATGPESIPVEHMQFINAGGRYVSGITPVDEIGASSLDADAGGGG